MFELLLQADRSMSDGLLDQAERTYWQLIELDPTNSIALAGLARISLQRGDERLARTFADRALSIDPESVAARQVVKALERGTAPASGPRPPELPIRGAEELEALGRRRGGGAAGSDVGADRAGSGRRKAAAAPQPSQPAAPGRRAGTGPGKDSRGRVRPDQFGPLPAEPLRERRQSGRLAAAAAAAAAAAREPARPRHETYHAMPSGRRVLEAGQPGSPPPDPFAAAEAAAAVAAVDAMDEELDTSTMYPPAARTEAEAEAAAAVAAVNSLDENAPETAPKRIPKPETSEAGSAQVADAPAAGTGVATVSPAHGPDTAAATGTGRAEREVRAPSQPVEADMSERDAELQALREAVAIVMGDEHGGGEAGGNAAGGPGDDMEPSGRPTAAAAANDAPAERELMASETPPGDAPVPPDGAPEAVTVPRRKGLFRRFRGG